MPQLVKGGKYIFGWSPVGSTGCIRIPGEAAREYGFLPGEKVIIMPGSRTSGGFAVAKKSVLAKTVLSNILEKNYDLADFKTDKGKTVRVGKRHLCWTVIDDNMNITLPPETLEKYGIRPGDRLLSGRGSYAGMAMLVRGPIIEEALKHPELNVYNPLN